ncbi:PHD-finger family protein expressed, partial [Trifolium medium]|nr:PHD-finger family protein expressed [Trifolium medium]
FERYYDQLVDEMISNDLAIRATVEKAELLIFPSTMLPSQYNKNKQEAPSKIHDAGYGNVASVLT